MDFEKWVRENAQKIMDEWERLFGSDISTFSCLHAPCQSGDGVDCNYCPLRSDVNSRQFNMRGKTVQHIVLFSYLGKTNG